MSSASNSQGSPTHPPAGGIEDEHAAAWKTLLVLIVHAGITAKKGMEKRNQERSTHFSTRESARIRTGGLLNELLPSQ